MPLLRISGADINYQIDDFTDPWCDKKAVKTILMHHANLRGLESLTPLVPMLARKYRVVRFDSRGVERSSAPPEPFKMTVAQLIDDTVSLMDLLKLDRVHFVGVQSGGMVGQMIAAHHPERMISLTLCGSPHKFTEGYKAARLMGEAEPGDAIKKMGFREWREKTFHLGVDTRRSDPKIAAWAIDVQSRVPLHVLTSQMRDLPLQDTAGILKDIKCPTLLMNGDRSNIVSLEMLFFMAKQIQNSQVMVFPNLSDSPYLVRSQECAEAILDFITEIDGDEKSGGKG